MTEDYRWSSYPALAGFEAAPEWLDRTWTLAQFGADPARQVVEFRRFVEAGASIKSSPWSETRGQLLIGTELWIEQMRNVLEGKLRSTDHPALRRYASRPRPAKIVDVVADVFEVTPEAIRTGHGSVERRLVAWLGCYEGLARFASIAAVLHLRSTSRVSALIAACERELGEDRNLRTALDRCLDLLRRELKPAPSGSASTTRRLNAHVRFEDVRRAHPRVASAPPATSVELPNWQLAS